MERTTMNTPNMTPADVSATVERIRTEIGTVIVGQTGLVRSVLVALLAALVVRRPQTPTSPLPVVLDDTPMEPCHG